jgi:hypothetical protein
MEYCGGATKANKIVSGLAALRELGLSYLIFPLLGRRLAPRAQGKAVAMSRLYDIMGSKEGQIIVPSSNLRKREEIFAMGYVAPCKRDGFSG